MMHGLADFKFVKAYIWPNLKISEKHVCGADLCIGVTNLDQETDCTVFLYLTSCCRHVPSKQISIYIYIYIYSPTYSTYSCMFFQSLSYISLYTRHLIPMSRPWGLCQDTSSVNQQIPLFKSMFYFNSSCLLHVSNILFSLSGRPYCTCNPVRYVFNAFLQGVSQDGGCARYWLVNVT